jgi:hypothetical protein
LRVSFKPIAVVVLERETIEGILTRMAKRGMAKVVSKTGGLDDFGIDSVKRGCLGLPLKTQLSQSPPNLCDLDCVFLSGVENVRFAGTHNLRYSRQSPKSGRIQNPVAIPFERATLICLARFVAAAFPKPWAGGRSPGLPSRHPRHAALRTIVQP